VTRAAPSSAAKGDRSPAQFDRADEAPISTLRPLPLAVALPVVPGEVGRRDLDRSARSSSGRNSQSGRRLGRMDGRQLEDAAQNGEGQLPEG